jgi:fructuronate reductase
MAPRPRLSQQTLAALPDGVAAPTYDRARLLPGIVHFGPGAFHRAHIASYIEALLPRDPRWGIAAIALRTGALGPALAAQDFLYTLAELDEPPRYRVLGALKNYVAAPTNRELALAQIEHPAVRLITITVTEKGYCLDANGALDLAHADIVHDLAEPGAPVSLVGWVAEGLARRRASRLAAPVVMSCDNVMANGPKLRGAVLDFVGALGHHGLADWIAAEVRFPATMVDSITPASDEALRTRVAAAIGLEDAAPVQRESFAQWVVEDMLGPEAPDLAAVGAQLTSDVHAWEQAKLRLLNGAHSTLAYVGLQRGCATVGEAIRDPQLGPFVERLMREDVAATLKPTRGLDIPAYIDALLQRLRNPAVTHRLIQIAADGSLKLPYRLLETIADLLAAGRAIARPSAAVAAWMGFVRNAARRDVSLNDPLAAKLKTVGQACTEVGTRDVPRFLALGEVFPRELAQDRRFLAALVEAYDDPDATLTG